MTGFLAGAGTSQAAAMSPCNIYAAAGTQCVAAHSTVRALYAAYNGPLYQVKRASDGATLNIGTLTAGGYANAAAQNSFCAGTSCIITVIYDQSPQHNNLTIEGPGGNGGQDAGANAAALPVLAGGHQVYGLYVTPGVGYRDDATAGVATGSAAMGEYMVASGTHVNGGCCFDYGNAETNNRDNGNGHMDAINFGTECWFAPCTGTGPWVQADLENGLFAGGNGNNPSNLGNSGTFLTALVKNNGTTTYAIKGGNAQSGSLTTWYNGSLPNIGGYAPMHQEGAIVLGTGGDDSNSSAGSFFEGVMTSGYPTDAADNAVQADIVSVGYALPGTPATGLIVAGDNSAHCADNNNGSATPGNKVQMWTCDGNAAAQNWTVAANGTIQIDGGCLDITGASFSNGTLIEWWPCNGGSNQQWQAVKGQLVNPASGKCLDDPAFNTANGTQLILWACNGGSNQQWAPP
ncbi:MAG TPA: arabinofuranosidase catalytic domain-containing protein [Streptosporangiaceae bacterium]|nr:arabinofuranosidase catalytic domain-containing protein [Streptosporangiaceae bacterium]